MRKKSGHVVLKVLLTLLLIATGAGAGVLGFRLYEREMGSFSAYAAQRAEARRQSEEAAASEKMAEEAASAAAGKAKTEVFKSEAEAAQFMMLSQTVTPTPTPVPDISREDLSAYDGEMPAEDQGIVKTESAIYTYEQMVKDLHFLTLRYPGILTVNIVDYTKDGRALYEVLLGNPEAARHVVIQYTVHSREYINSLLAMRQIESHCARMAEGDDYSGIPYGDLFAGICFHVMPMANPDGVTVSQFGKDGMRTEAAKNLIQYCWESDTLLGRTTAPIDSYTKTFKANANGVDLNKNFPVGWDGYEEGVPVPSTDCYKGSAAGSEIETQAIMHMVENNPTVCVISYHSAGNLIYWHYGVENEDLLAVDRNLALNLSNLTGYPTAKSAKYDRHLAGGCSDYFMWEKGIPAVTIETGSGKCPLSISAFEGIWKANRDVYPLLASMYGE